MGKNKILFVLTVIFVSVLYVGILIGSLYLGKYLYDDFGIGGLMLMCCILLLGAISTHNNK